MRQMWAEAALALGVMSSPQRDGRCPPTRWASSPNGGVVFPQRENSGGPHGCCRGRLRGDLVRLVRNSAACKWQRAFCHLHGLGSF